MLQIAGQDHQSVLECGCGNDDVGEARRLPLSTRAIGQHSRRTRSCNVEGEYSLAIKMQQCLKPSVEIGRFMCRALAPRLGDAVLDFRDRDRRPIELRRATMPSSSGSAWPTRGRRRLIARSRSSALALQRLTEPFHVGENGVSGEFQ
jgi:hypothetical protein